MPCRDGRARGSQALAVTSELLLQAKLVKLGTPDREGKVAYLSLTEHPVVSRGNL